MSRTPKERDFQSDVLRELRERFPGCVVLKTDPSTIRGIPDRIILFRNRWAALEFKRGKNAPVRPLQEDWVETLDAMSFSAFIYPENREEVLNAMERSFAL